MLSLSAQGALGYISALGPTLQQSHKHIQNSVFVNPLNYFPTYIYLFPAPLPLLVYH